MNEGRALLFAEGSGLSQRLHGVRTWAAVLLPRVPRRDQKGTGAAVSDSRAAASAGIAAAHRSRLVQDYIASLSAWMHQAFLPPYAPESNRVECIWRLLEAARTQRLPQGFSYGTY